MDGDTTDIGRTSVSAGGSVVGDATAPARGSEATRPASRAAAGSAEPTAPPPARPRVREAATGRAAAAATAGTGRPVMSGAVVDAWSRLLAYLVVITMVSITIMIPVAGAVLASAVVLLLRAADLAATRGPRGRRSLRAVGGAVAGAVLSLSYAVSAGVVVAVALVSLVRVGISADPLVACAWGVGTGVYVVWAGPGVRVPCRRLARVVAATVPDSRRMGLAAITLSALAFLAVAGAVAFRPSFAPMYALQNSLQSELGHLQSVVEVGTG